MAIDSELTKMDYTNSQKLAILKSSPLFQNFSDDILAQFLSLAEMRHHSAEEIIFAEMTEGNEIFLVLEGEVVLQVALANADRDIEAVTISPGETLGELQFLETGPRLATAIAKTDTKVLVWQATQWQEISEQNFEVGYRLAQGIVKLMSKRLRCWNEKLLNLISWGLDF